MSLFQANGLETWLKPLTGLRTAIAVVNYLNYGNTLKYTATLQQLNLNNTAGYSITEPFEGVVIGKLVPNETFHLYVNPTGIQIVVATPLS